MTRALDYGTCAALLRGAPDLERRFLGCGAQELSVPSVVRGELLLAARRSARPRDNARLVEAFLEPLATLPFDEACAEEYASLREDLALRADALGSHDVLTAATALGHRATLVTVRPETYRALARLRLEPWP